jgi:archaellum component FlaC
METRSSARAERNGYITMFDTSMSRADDSSVDTNQVMRERVERLEGEGERVNGELNLCKKELKDKCREIALLKKRIALLEKQTNDLDAYKKLNKIKSQEIEQKNISISELLKEIESSGREREALVEGFKRSNNVLLQKLREAEKSNLVLRNNFDDLFERVEGQKDCETERNSVPKITQRPGPRKQTDNNNQNIFKNDIFIVGDEYAKNMGTKLFHRGVRRIQVISKPNVRFANLNNDIEDAINLATRGSTLVLIIGNNRHIFEEKGYYVSKMRSIMKTTAERGIRLLISSFHYSKNVQRNNVIYSENCRLYDIVGEWDHVDILELNDEKQRLHEVIDFKLKYPLKKIRNLISLTHGEELCKTYPVKNVKYVPIKSNTSGKNFLERGGERGNLVRIRVHTSL